MAIKFEKTQVKGGFPVFWRGEREVLPGDFAVKGTYPEGTILKEGTPIKLDFENMECIICKSARIVEGGTTTKPRVIKGSMFQINDAVKVGDSSGTIKSISTANESYDEITLSAAMTEAVAGADLLGGDEIPDAVIETTKEYTKANGFPTVSAAYGARILKDVAYPIPETWLQGYSMKNNPEIKYIRQ